MQLKTITSAKDVPMLGVEFVKTDKQITEIIIGSLHIRKGESYSKGLEVLIEAPFEEEKRHRLTATIEGFEPKVSYHDSKYDAQNAGNPLEDKGATVAIDEVTVLVDADGNIVGDGGPYIANAIGHLPDVPF